MRKPVGLRTSLQCRIDCCAKGDRYARNKEVPPPLPHTRQNPESGFCAAAAPLDIGLMVNVAITTGARHGKLFCTPAPACAATMPRATVDRNTDPLQTPTGPLVLLPSLRLTPRAFCVGVAKHTHAHARTRTHTHTYTHTHMRSHRREHHAQLIRRGCSF